MSSTSKAVMYARVSSKEQEREGFSIPAQLKTLRQYASENNFEIVREFEEAETAKSTGRTQFNEMLKFLRNPKNQCRTILVEKTDRLYRNFKDYLVIDDLNVEIHCVKEGEIISGAAHSSRKFLHGIRVLMAKQYIDNLSEEVKKGFREKAEQGRYPAGKVPFGYYIDKNLGKIVVDQDRAILVRQMFSLYSENKVSLQMLAAWARKNSVVNRNGKRPITKSQIERILKHRFYLGEFEWNGKVFKGDHEPIVTRQLFEAVQQAFKNHNKPYYEAHQFAFGDLMTCTTCGCKITAQIKKGRYVYYHCTGMRGNDHKLYIPEPKIAEQFGEYLRPLALSKDHLKTVFDRMNDRHREHSFNQAREQARLSNRLTQLDKWIEQAYVDKLENKITESQWQSLTRNWQIEAENLRTLLDSNSDESEVRLLTANRILELCQRLPVLWDRQDFSEKRKLVDLVYSNCELDGRTLSVTYRKPFSIVAEGHETQNWLNDPDCHGTAVLRGTTGFDVVELQNGTGNASFSYRVVAKRRGFEKQRLERMTGLKPEQVAAETIEQLEQLSIDERLEAVNRQANKEAQERLSTVTKSPNK